jgi:hypothetical protein
MKRWLGISIIIVSLAGLAWTSLPLPVKTIVYESRDPAWSLKIVQPEYMRAGDKATLSVEVAPPDVMVTAQDTNTVAVRLDFPGLFKGPNLVDQIVPLDRSARFPWTIGPAQPGQYEGRIWIYSGLQKTLINARTLQIEVKGPDTLSLYILRIASVAVGLAGLFLAYFWRSRRAI